MNIAKQKEIVRLREEAKDLESEFNYKLTSTRDDASLELLSAAQKDIINYLKDEGFEIDNTKAEMGQLVANLDGIWVNLSKRPLVLTVTMSNGEHYSITVESNLERLSDNHSYKATDNQDSEISRLRRRIDEIKEKLNEIDNQTFRYCLTKEKRGLVSVLDYSKQTFHEFKSLLDVMFS